MVGATWPATLAVATFAAGISAADLSDPQPRQVARPGMFDGA